MIVDTYIACRHKPWSQLCVRFSPPSSYNSLDCTSARHAAQTNIHLHHCSFDPSKELRLPTRQIVHRLFGHVEARGRVVNGEHVNGSAVVGHSKAFAARGAVPAGDCVASADVGTARMVSLVYAFSTGTCLESLTSWRCRLVSASHTLRA